MLFPGRLPMPLLSSGLLGVPAEGVVRVAAPIEPPLAVTVTSSVQPSLMLSDRIVQSPLGSVNASGLFRAYAYRFHC